MLTLMRNVLLVGSGCPVGLPFANCSYEDVCSPQATCDFYPNARCLVDHCGGCHAVFVGVGGAHLDCTTGEGKKEKLIIALTARLITVPSSLRTVEGVKTCFSPSEKAAECR